MRSCREVSQLASQSLDRPLGFWDRWTLRLHLMMCRNCDNFFEQIKALRTHSVTFSKNGRKDPD
ncbi:MAG: zf-HC2 domain-containing protein [Dehalococcoidia bacterium]